MAQRLEVRIANVSRQVATRHHLWTADLEVGCEQFRIQRLENVHNEQFRTEYAWVQHRKGIVQKIFGRILYFHCGRQHG